MEPGLLSDAQLLDDLAVALDILLLEVMEQPFTLTYHGKESPATGVVLRVDLEMLGKLGDPVGHQGHLGFCGATVGGRASEFLENLFLFLCC